MNKIGIVYILKFPVDVKKFEKHKNNVVFLGPGINRIEKTLSYEINYKRRM